MTKRMDAFLGTGPKPVVAPAPAPAVEAKKSAKDDFKDFVSKAQSSLKPEAKGKKKKSD